MHPPHYLRAILPMVLITSAFAEEPVPASPPKLEVASQDVVSTRVRYDGGRRITFQKLDPKAMSEKEKALRPPPSPLVPQQPAAAVNEPVNVKPLRDLRLGASVIIRDQAKPEQAITLLSLWPDNGGTPVTLWVNANFLWLSGAGHEIETADARHSLMLFASPGGEEVPADLPFPENGKATLVIAEGDPSEEQLEPIDRLLERYDRDKVRLREEYERKLRDAAKIEAARRADPPEKKNLIIRYWKAEKAEGSYSELLKTGGAR